MQYAVCFFDSPAWFLGCPPLSFMERRHEKTPVHQMGAAAVHPRVLSGTDNRLYPAADCGAFDKLAGRRAFDRQGQRLVYGRRHQFSGGARVLCVALCRAGHVFRRQLGGGNSGRGGLYRCDSGHPMDAARQNAQAHVCADVFVSAGERDDECLRIDAAIVQPLRGLGRGVLRRGTVLYFRLLAVSQQVL